MLCRPIMHIVYLRGSHYRLVSRTQVRCHLILMMPGPGSHNLQPWRQTNHSSPASLSQHPLSHTSFYLYSNIMQNRKQQQQLIPAQNCHKMNGRLNISHYLGSVEQETRGLGRANTHNNVLRLINGVLQSVTECPDWATLCE